MAELGYVAVAEVARPHGVAGEVRLTVYHADSDLLLRRPPMRLRLPDGSIRDERLRSVRRIPGGCLVRFESVADRTAVEALRGAVVEVPRTELGDAGEGQVFHCDLVGCEVHLNGGIGRVVRVLSYPTCDALLVERTDGGRLEIPFTDAFVSRVDVVARVVELSNLPE